MARINSVTRFVLSNSLAAPMVSARDFVSSSFQSDIASDRDRKGIEEQTKVWNKIILDRQPDLAEWVEVLKTVHKRKIQILAFANNHYAGYGPGTIEQFRQLWRRQVTETGKRNRVAEQGQLFK